MDLATKQLLKNTQNDLDRQIEDMRRRRNEEDRKYIISQIGDDLVKILVPLLENIAANSRMTKEEMREVIKEIKVDSPKVNVEPAQINVDAKVPPVSVPKIEFPKNELVKAIKEAIAKVKLPKIETPKVEMPKEIKVAKFEQLLEGIKKIAEDRLSFDLSTINRDNPLPVILYDSQGRYADLQKIIVSMASGGSKFVEVKKVQGASAISGGTKTVTAAGTPEQITSTSKPIRRVWIQALDTNTGTIVVGGPDVDETSASRKGIALFATQGQWLNVSDLNMLWIDVAVNGEGIHYLYEE